MSDAATAPSTGTHERTPARASAQSRAAEVRRPGFTWRVAGHLLLCAALILGVATVVGLGVHHLGTRGVLAPDLSIDRWLVSHRTTSFNDMSRVGSMLASTDTAVAVAVVAFVVLRWWLGRFYESCVLVVALGGELLIFLAVAAIVHRPRPPVPRLDGAPPTSSFPSGHTAASVALYGFLAVMLWRYAARHALALGALVILLVPIAVAASRLYRGMHYPTDVIAGALVGGIWLACVLWQLLPAPSPESRPRPNPRG